MIEAFQMYKYFMAVKLHFTTDKYDVFESEGRVSAYRPAFEKRNDKYLFTKLGEKFSTPREAIDYLVSNFAYGHKNVVYDPVRADELYDAWTKRKESRSYTFQKQLDVIARYVESERIDFHELFSIEDNAPPILTMYIGGDLHLETLVILNELENFLPSWEPMIMVWGDQLRILNKSKRFVRFDKNRVQLTYLKYKTDLVEMHHGTF